MPPRPTWPVCVLVSKDLSRCSVLVSPAIIRDLIFARLRGPIPGLCAYKLLSWHAMSINVN
jgi:hypothetical protein